MEEETETIAITKIGFIQRKQDYSKELFSMSRNDLEEYTAQEGAYHTIVERAWCGDLAAYIMELENYVKDTYKDIVKLRRKL